jgi:Bacterial PH domain
MSLFDALMGNASEVNTQTLHSELSAFLVEGEVIERGFKLIRDLFVFTNKRLILVDKQGLSGNKMEILSVPYKNITYFSMENAGAFDRDSELKFWIKGNPTPIVYEIKKDIPIQDLYRMLGRHVLLG